MKQINSKTPFNFKCLSKAWGLLIALLTFTTVNAQHNIKPATIGIHYSLTDFETAAQIKSSSFHDVLKNKLWSKPPQMMTGIGIDYLKGITSHIDFAAGFNYTKGVNNYKLPLSNTIPYTLLTLDAAVNIKLLSDKYYVRPYLIAGAGIYSQDKVGFYAPVGGGFQFNLFNAALVNIQTQFRAPFSKKDNGNFYYQFGMASAISRKKEKQLPIPPAAIQEEIKPPVVAELPKEIYKDIAVMVSDEATGLPLQYAAVIVLAADGTVYKDITHADGIVVISNLKAGSYTVSAKLNNIDAANAVIAKESFDIAANQLQVTLTHNDPRFTLTGYVVDKKSKAGIGNTTIAINNITQGSISFATSNISDGNFYTQLESSSDFIISGKKENYISNIENVSTKGLSRSTTLYVKLELEIEEVKVGESIVLNKIFFETGKSILNIRSSSDLDKLILFLKDNPTVKMEIQGYTDNTGSLSINNTLSKNRAFSVMNYLIKNGVDKNRLQAKGFGPAKPIADNKTIEGKAQNRRVEMELIK